jgi:hypothetical protein
VKALGKIKLKTPFCGGLSTYGGVKGWRAHNAAKRLAFGEARLAKITKFDKNYSPAVKFAEKLKQAAAAQGLEDATGYAWNGSRFVAPTVFDPIRQRIDC